MKTKAGSAIEKIKASLNIIEDELVEYVVVQFLPGYNGIVVLDPDSYDVLRLVKFKELLGCAADPDEQEIEDGGWIKDMEEIERLLERWLTEVRKRKTKTTTK